MSGTGEAARFTELPWVRLQAERQLGFTPSPGTLNVTPVSSADQAAWQALKSTSGITLSPEPGYCAARCYSVAVNGWEPAALVVPEVPGYPEDRLEVLAPVRLRDQLFLADGSRVTIESSNQ